MDLFETLHTTFSSSSVWEESLSLNWLGVIVRSSIQYVTENWWSIRAVQLSTASDITSVTFWQLLQNTLYTLTAHKNILQAYIYVNRNILFFTTAEIFFLKMISIESLGHFYRTGNVYGRPCDAPDCLVSVVRCQKVVHGHTTHQCVCPVGICSLYINVRCFIFCLPIRMAITVSEYVRTGRTILLNVRCAECPMSKSIRFQHRTFAPDFCRVRCIGRVVCIDVKAQQAKLPARSSWGLLWWITLPAQTIIILNLTDKIFLLLSFQMF